MRRNVDITHMRTSEKEITMEKIGRNTNVAAQFLERRLKVSAVSGSQETFMKNTLLLNSSRSQTEYDDHVYKDLTEVGGLETVGERIDYIEKTTHNHY